MKSRIVGVWMHSEVSIYSFGCQLSYTVSSLIIIDCLQAHKILDIWRLVVWITGLSAQFCESTGFVIPSDSKHGIITCTISIQKKLCTHQLFCNGVLSVCYAFVDLNIQAEKYVSHGIPRGHVWGVVIWDATFTHLL